jgi:hypothetical protein
VGEVDAPPINEFTSWRESDENRRVTMLDHANNRPLPNSRFQQVPPSMPTLCCVLLPRTPQVPIHRMNIR